MAEFLFFDPTLIDFFTKTKSINNSFRKYIHVIQEEDLGKGWIALMAAIFQPFQFEIIHQRFKIIHWKVQVPTPAVRDHTLEDLQF